MWREVALNENAVAPLVATKATWLEFDEGAYNVGIGGNCEASYQATRLPLLRWKVVYVLAHIRGGKEMGGLWYNRARYLTKKNTFNGEHPIRFAWLSLAPRSMYHQEPYLTFLAI